MRVGITLPQFREDPEPALATARRAEEAGLDGVFVFDHLWPMHQPERPALHSMTLLGALAGETDRVTLGPLVARVGLVPDAVLVHALVTMHRMIGERFVAGLGTGDSHNRDENVAYGVPFRPKAERLHALIECCGRLRTAGVRVWVGGGSADVRAVAGEWADEWNAWGGDLALFEERAATVSVPANWGGQVLVARTPEEAADKLARHGTRPGLVHGTVDDLAAHLRALAAAGATWAICAPLDVGVDADSVEMVAEAARRSQ